MTSPSDMRLATLADTFEMLCSREIDTPFYFYDGDGGRAAVADLMKLLKDRLDRYATTVFIPVFANPCFPLIDFLIADIPRVGILVNSLPELVAVRSFPWRKTPKVAFAGGILSQTQVERVCHSADIYYAASIRNFEMALRVADSAADLGVRLDLSGSGELRGIPPHEIQSYLSGSPEKADYIRGIHSYQGPNAPDFDSCLAYARALLEFSELFPSLRQINFSGGWPFDYREKEISLPSSQPCLWDYLSELRRSLEDADIPSHSLEVAFEPGKFLLAAYGYFYCRVIECQPTGARQIDVHVDASFVHLPSLKLKSRQHAVTLLDSTWIPRGSQDSLCRLHGCSGLSTDFLMPGRIVLPQPKENDVVVIHDLGVYGWAGSYNFLGLQRPAEYMKADGSICLVRQQQPEDHLLQDLTREPSLGKDQSFEQVYL